MNEERVCICPKCKSWYYVNKKNSGPKCPDCNCFLICTNISSEEFDSMPNEKRNSIMDKCIFKNSDTDRKKINDSSLWIVIMEIVSTIIIAVSVLMGVFILTSADYIGIGILGFAAIVLIGIIAVSSSMVFVGMARDIKAIRSKLDM